MYKFSSTDIRTWALLGQRGTLGKVLYDMIGERKNIIAMTADQGALIGFHRIQNQYPDNFINMGISEQNAIGVAAGLSNEGYIPFLAFQAAFTSLRCADQTHVAMAYMGLNIKLIGIFSGLTQGDCGPTHYALHDIALYRSFPKVTVLSPSDATQMVKVLQATSEVFSPTYIRIGGPNNLPIVYKEDFDFQIGKAITLREGKDVAIIATGSMVYNSLKAAEILSSKGISSTIMDMHTIKPLDKQAVKESLSHKLIVTVEEHSIYGGLGGAVAENLSLLKKRPPHLIIGTQGEYPHAASYSYLLEQAGLTPEKIALKIENTYKEIC